MRPRSTELQEYLKRQQMVREEIVAIIEDAVNLFGSEAIDRDEYRRQQIGLADRVLVVLQAVCNVRPTVIEEIDDGSDARDDAGGAGGKGASVEVAPWLRRK